MAGVIGNKGGGRKTKKEEIAAAIEVITEEALLKLAQSKVKKQLDQELDFTQTKDIALPIVIKGMTQKLAGKDGGAIQVAMLTPEQQESLAKLTLPNVDTPGIGQSNNGNNGGTQIPM